MVTFLEDALRIITQWSDQLIYLHDYRHSMLCLSSEYPSAAANIAIYHSSCRADAPLSNYKRHCHDYLLLHDYRPKEL